MNIIANTGKRQNAASDHGAKVIDNTGAEAAEQAPTVMMLKTVYDTNDNGRVDIAESIYVDILAAENISKYHVVTSDGFIANSNVDSHKNKVLGIATQDIPNGFNGKVLLFGDLDNPLWGWTVNKQVFLNGTAISDIAPSTGFILPIGKIRYATRILVNPKTSIKL